MMKRLASDAVERILRATALEIKSAQVSSPDKPPVPPPDLGESLHKYILYYYGAFQRRSDKKNLDRVRRLRGLSKAAARLADLSKADDDWEWTQTDDNEAMRSDIAELQRSVEWEIGLLDDKLMWGDDGETIGWVESRNRAETLRTRSPFEWLVGEYLPNAFREFFGKKPTLRRKDNKLYGPYIQFAEQVLIEFEITKNGRPYGREAIAKAFGDVKRGRTRRVPRRR